MKPAQVEIYKTDTEGRPLANSTLLLEWSEDGVIWEPVAYTDSQSVSKGTCRNTNLIDGTLTTDATGMLTFSGLHPLMYYRLTEVATADGYQLLADPVFEGKIPLDTLEISLRVINSPIFTLPNTGDNSLMLIPIGIPICALIGIGALLCLRKKSTV